ncbi:Uncharacterized protein BM_BM17899 [Brugia malayi]|uniref:Uncharacterized protein n=1 Tax=Brugia malayi TaxID=6279 RepID=A0A4E9ETJ8_BRUMA|nr:Uncharacterized protein BM_BM17899 [Brugia malayi]VIO86062.1 Uncharacterized protein BM_BM17899 [Brugia malayi]
MLTSPKEYVQKWIRSSNRALSNIYIRWIGLYGFPFIKTDIGIVKRWGNSLHMLHNKSNAFRAGRRLRNHTANWFHLA